MTWSKEIYEETLKGMRSPYEKNTDYLDVKRLFAYANKHGILIQDIPEETRETFVTRKKEALK